MTPVLFKPYYPGGSPVTMMVERITHWYQVDYNGNYGTCIVLDTGKEIVVGEWPYEVEKKIRAAKEESHG